MSKQALHIAILAAGAGTRMRSSLPKVLHPVMGKPMLQWVIDTAKHLHPKNIWVVTGHQSQIVEKTINDPSLHWIEQKPLLGTGHAVNQLYPHLKSQVSSDDYLLILFADNPLLTTPALHQMIESLNQHALVLLNLIVKNPHGFGRVVRDDQNQIAQIVEEKDANIDQKMIDEIFSGTMLIRYSALTQLLPHLTPYNNQNEYYLTQMVELAHERHFSIGSVLDDNDTIAGGVNDRVQLAAVEKLMQQQAAKILMEQGVSIVDPDRFDLRGTLHANQDVYIDINCIIEGSVSIDTGTTIGAHCLLKNCTLGKNVTIQPYTMIDGATIGDNAMVGPFARIRPGTILEEAVRIGNFVEVKKSHFGKGSKANHLAYLGDAKIGSQVNIGAGTITANYDGKNKHPTHIEDHASIGSNAVLVAPVIIGNKATVGAGSVITKDVPAEHLSLTRTEQKMLKWQRKK